MTFPWLFRPHESIVGFGILPAPEGDIAHLRATRLPDEPGLAFEAVTSQEDYDPALLQEWENRVVTALECLAPPAERPMPFRDRLTGLLNREGFQRQAQRLLSRAASRPSPSVWMFLINVDDFKAINDTVGHDFGDRVLTAVAARLQELLPPGASLGRLGGDEFGAALAADAHAGESVREALRHAFRDPIMVAGAPFTLTATVGAAFADATGTRIDDILREADLSLSRAKDVKKAGNLVDA